MSRIKATFAVLALAAMVAVVPSANAAAKGQVVISGSSAMWQTIGLAAFNSGNCTTAKVKVTPPCFHYTDNTAFNLTDGRPAKKVKGSAPAVDTGDLWIVWDSSTATINVWTYIKVDSVVGDRCFFANPVCTIITPSGYVWTTVGNKIASALWGGDTVPPTAVQTLFGTAGATTGGLKVNTAATDIRPEDGLFAQCRVNSLLGNGTVNGGGDDGLDGLGYGTNPSGQCPSYTTVKSLTGLKGTAIASGITGSTSVANVMAFNLSGKDPFTNSTIPAYTTISVGADPIIFVISRSTSVNAGFGAGTLNATDAHLQTVFSGADCDAHVINSAIAAGTDINAYLREPLSGTFNTTEASVFRGPIEIPGGVTGTSQEANVGATNPLSNAPCVSGTGHRTRGIGTGEVMNGKGTNGGILNSGGTNLDGIAYTFFSFGNVSKLAASSKYGYLTLNSIDGIGPFYSGNPWTNQQLPSCTAPCTEANIWGTQGTSFPHLRDGSYTAWSLLRLVTTTVNSANVQDLVNGSHTYAVNTTPDYIPAQGVPLGCVGGACTDAGLQYFHTHYQQADGAGNNLGPAPSNGSFNANHNPSSGDAGGDMGGCTEATPLAGDFGWIQVQSTPSCSNAAVR